MASTSPPRTPRHRILTWPMVVVALLVSVVLAVGSVPVAAFSVRGVGGFRSSSPMREWNGAIDRDDHVEVVARRSSLGWTSYGTYMVSKPLDRPEDAAGLAWITPSEDPRPEFAKMRYSGHESWVVSYQAAGWPRRAAAGRTYDQPQVSSIHTESLASVVLGHTVHYIPLRPIWPGLLANTLFYAALAMAPMVLLRWRRTRRRRARGLCVACGYELGDGVGVCPECGLEAQRSSRTPRVSEGA